MELLLRCYSLIFFTTFECPGGVAQLVRARGSYPRRRRFDSYHRHHFPARTILVTKPVLLIRAPSEFFRPFRALVSIPHEVVDAGRR